MIFSNQLFHLRYLVGQPSPNPTKTRFGTELSPNNALGAESPNRAPTEIDQEGWGQSVDGIPSDPAADLELLDDLKTGHV